MDIVKDSTISVRVSDRVSDDDEILRSLFSEYLNTYPKYKVLLKRIKLLKENTSAVSDEEINLLEFIFENSSYY